MNTTNEFPSQVQARAVRPLLPRTAWHQTTHSILEEGRNHGSGTIGLRAEVRMLLQEKYRLSKQAARWLQDRAPYRPIAVERKEVPVGYESIFLERFLEADIEAAVLKFEAELRQETATLWSHPEVEGRFTRKQWVDV